MLDHQKNKVLGESGPLSGPDSQKDDSMNESRYNIFEL
jgi:hypothetical protein